MEVKTTGPATPVAVAVSVLLPTVSPSRHDVIVATPLELVVTFVVVLVAPFTVPLSEKDRAVRALEPALKDVGGVASYDEQIAKLSVVGVGMRTHSGVAATLFEALAEGGINLELISTSEIKISVVIAKDQADEAARVAHAAFGLEKL